MLAIQAPSATALMRPARRDSPRPTATVRSASWPRPNTRRVPSGIPTTSPAGVLTRAATATGDWGVMALLTAERIGGAAACGPRILLP
jgi:hypothetical protein